ncbi:MAG: hypothetical protein A2Y63_03320 [Candidatus Riflebacteria bacterium RBG_13_59_9]|nr:MAG: hypothetical protein A2Y63_03320 [Candidatus Riflebacteria bacterium RBG_13_59_9]
MKEMKWVEAVKLASPYSYALAVSLNPEGRPNAMGLGWWCYLSAKPKLLGIAIAPERYTHECIQHTREFTLCFPSKVMALAAWKCGLESGREMDKFAEFGLKALPAKIVKTPLIKGSTVAFECKLAQEVAVGDHTLFVGEIVAAHGDPEKKEHLFTQFFSKLVSIANDGGCDWKLDKTLGIPGQLKR